MDTIRDIAASLCITLIVTAIFTMLLPGQSWNRFARFAVRLFFLLCMVTPLVGGDLTFSLDADRYFSGREGVRQDLADLTNRQLRESFEQNLEASAREILEKNGISAQKIEARAHITDEQRIDITSLKITLQREEEMRAGKISSLLENAFGIPPQLEFPASEGEQNG